jgi:hypothetical protein
LLIREREKNTPFSMHIKTSEPLDIPVELFLASLRYEQRGKLDQMGIEIDSFDKESSNISFEIPMGGTDQTSKLNGIH